MSEFVWGRKKPLHTSFEIWHTNCDGCRFMDAQPPDERLTRINHGTWKYYCDKKGGFIDRVEICKMKKCPYGGGK